jgi:hypothetical protein
MKAAPPIGEPSPTVVRGLLTAYDGTSSHHGVRSSSRVNFSFRKYSPK